MQQPSDKKVYIALVHHPVLSKKGDVICSAVTNLDIHDIARAARTYGVERYFIVTTLDDQKDLTGKILRHWTEGPGGDVNPDRREALGIIRLVHSIEEAVEEIKTREKDRVKVVATTARTEDSAVAFSTLRDEMDEGGVYLLLFGTAWGLSGEVLEKADSVLMPVQAGSGYNHLSVRSAVSIVLDRLISEDRDSGQVSGDIN